jgi:hypothetical protein
VPQLGTPQVCHHCSKQKKESSREQGFLKKRVGVRVDDRASMEMQRGIMKNQHGLCMGKGFEFERGCVGACGSEDPEESVRTFCIGAAGRDTLGKCTRLQRLDLGWYQYLWRCCGGVIDIHPEARTRLLKPDDRLPQDRQSDEQVGCDGYKEGVIEDNVVVENTFPLIWSLSKHVWLAPGQV